MGGVESWNRAAMLKHLWHLCADEEQSIWSCWVRSYLIRDRNFWQLKFPGDCSWTWRKILKLRSLARDKIKCVVGNGNSTSLWYDNWHPLGPFVSKFGNSFISASGLGEEAKVGAIIEGGDWNWPSGSSEWQEIISAMPSDLKPNIAIRDRVIWLNAPSGKFSIKLAWDGIRSRSPVVNWHHLVWHSKSIPRHSFILWLAIRGRLSTQDHLYNHGIIQAVRCALCGEMEESLDHLYFSCHFSDRIWQLLCDKCNIPWVNRSWEETLQWMAISFKGKSLRSLIAKLMFAATGIWRERNARMFQGRSRGVSNVFYEIMYWVRARINSLHGFQPSQENRWLVGSWRLSDAIVRAR